MIKVFRALVLSAILLAVPLGQAFAVSAGDAQGVSQTDEWVMAEATVVPARWSELQFLIGGDVAEVMVAIGDKVQEGDVLAVLDDTHAQLAVLEAEAGLATAQAQLALVQAGPRAAEVAAAEAQLNAARGDLRQAIALRDQLDAGTAEAEVAGARGQLEAQRAERRQLEATLHWAEDDGDDEKAEDLRDQLRILDLKIAAAQAKLAALPDTYAARLDGANAGVWAARAQVDVAEAELALLLAGPTEAAVALARADVLQAEAKLAAAKVRLERHTLRAPFDGTLTQVPVEVGDTVSLGRVVMILADLDHLQLETSNLTELEVVRIVEGQSVAVSVDALPDLALQGHVTRIKQQSANVRGDVTYPVTIELDEVPAALRWGMTAAVEFLNE